MPPAARIPAFYASHLAGTVWACMIPPQQENGPDFRDLYPTLTDQELKEADAHSRMGRIFRNFRAARHGPRRHRIERSASHAPRPRRRAPLRRMNALASDSVPPNRRPFARWRSRRRTPGIKLRDAPALFTMGCGTPPPAAAALAMGHVRRRAYLMPCPLSGFTATGPDPPAPFSRTS
jgi:hypothetical protein